MPAIGQTHVGIADARDDRSAAVADLEAQIGVGPADPAGTVTVAGHGQTAGRITAKGTEARAQGIALEFRVTAGAVSDAQAAALKLSKTLSSDAELQWFFGPFRRVSFWT